VKQDGVLDLSLVSVTTPEPKPEEVILLSPSLPTTHHSRQDSDAPTASPLN
jgi:hypothetical protein